MSTLPPLAMVRPLQPGGWRVRLFDFATEDLEPRDHTARIELRGATVETVTRGRETGALDVAVLSPTEADAEGGPVFLVQIRLRPVETAWRDGRTLIRARLVACAVRGQASPAPEPPLDADRARVRPLVVDVEISPEPAGLSTPPYLRPDDSHRSLGREEFVLTERHLALLRRASIDWSGIEYGAPNIDPKRPYGNGDLFRGMVQALGSEVPDADSPGGWDWPPDDLAAELTRLHRETEIALEIVLRTATAVPGRYVRESWGADWVLPAPTGH